MVVPHGDEETYNFKLSHRFVQWCGIVLITLFICSVSVVYSLRQTRIQIASHQELLAENRMQQEHILFLAKQTNLLQDQLASIKDLDHSIRELMQLEEPTASQPMSLFTSAATGPATNSVPLTNTSTSLAATILRTQQSIEQIKESIPETEGSLKDLERKVQLQREKEMATPSIRPTLGSITSGFGYRRSPFGWAREFHSGVDIGAPRGTAVYATGNGVIRMATYNSGYGNVIFIDHGFGFSTVYAHLSRMEAKVGQKVTKGQLIGTVGSTGRSTAPHLHYEVRVNGTAVNPYNYLTGGR
jgi:murein DD-endopeptidase MepM/ murein hydrolase activator NlpD